MFRNLSELFQYRALLWALTTRELKARYRGSALGVVWTLLNPTLLMLVYALLFSVYMRVEMEHYTYFMFVGLLPWIWFSTAVAGGATSVCDRRDLLTKVRFPPQVLPTTVVLHHAINFIISLPLLVGLMVISGVMPSGWVLLLPLLWLIQLAFTLGLSYLVAAATVVFRDLQQIVANLLTLVFFLTPVLYASSFIPEKYRALAIYANPMAALVTSYHDVLYYHRAPDPLAVLSATVAAVSLLAIGSAFFERQREDFAELV